MKQADVVGAVGRLRDDADAATRTMGDPDVDAIVEAAATGNVHAGHPKIPGRRAFGLIPAIASAAAVALVVLTLRLVGPPGVPDAASVDPPEQLVGFVDSLYDDGSYVIDEIAVHFTHDSASGERSGAYLDGVWTDVLDELAGPGD